MKINVQIEINLRQTKPDINLSIIIYHSFNYSIDNFHGKITTFSNVESA